jgi:hypothetical protein
VCVTIWGPGGRLEALLAAGAIHGDATLLPFHCMKFLEESKLLQVAADDFSASRVKRIIELLFNKW